MNIFSKVYQLVGKIPKGRTATYGQIARLAGTSPRIVGYALHRNPDPEHIPCHRVVNREGRLAPNYRFGGWREQKRKLLDEGVKFRDSMRVDLNSQLFTLYLRGGR